MELTQCAYNVLTVAGVRSVEFHLLFHLICDRILNVKVKQRGCNATTSTQTLSYDVVAENSKDNPTNH